MIIVRIHGLINLYLHLKLLSGFQGQPQGLDIRGGHIGSQQYFLLALDNIHIKAGTIIYQGSLVRYRLQAHLITVFAALIGSKQKTLPEQPFGWANFEGFLGKQTSIAVDADTRSGRPHALVAYKHFQRKLIALINGFIVLHLDNAQVMPRYGIAHPYRINRGVHGQGIRSKAGVKNAITYHY